MPLFFLGGVHGVGKSSLANTLSVRLSAKALSASQLIRDEGTEPSAPDKRVSDINGNQERLLSALARHQRVHKRILLDGHFCLRSGAGDAVAIPVEVFRRMAPAALLLLVNAPIAILHRLERRDGLTHQPADVIALLECEQDAALMVSKELQIPLRILRASSSIDETCGFLESAVG